MWKKERKRENKRFFYPLGIVYKGGFFPQKDKAFIFPQGFHKKRTFIVDYFLELMLVVISFTVSAKDGSLRICFSTFSKEWSTVE